MRALPKVFLVCLISCSVTAFAQKDDAAKTSAYYKSMKTAVPPDYNETERLALVANPLGCEEHPHAPGRNQPGYLWQRDGKPHITDDYDKHRAFYGCFDWHSAVNSTWMMVSLIKSDPTITLAPAIRNDLQYRLQKQNIDGEMAYFTHLQSLGADFEKPYGYSWVIKLYGDLKTWNDPEGERSATTLEPLYTWMKGQLIAYFNSLNYPVRVGLHPNTALDMNFILDSTDQTHDAELQKTVHDNALRLFANDKHCPVQGEPVFGDFASPCLVEAALMGRVMQPEAYAKWLDDFLPPVYSTEFQVYAAEIDALHGNNRDTTGTEDEGMPNSHLIGLSFQRAEDFLWIARSLPPNDPRVPVYRRFSEITGKQGYDKIGLGGYLSTHWIATYALMYENLLDHKQPPAQHTGR